MCYGWSTVKKAPIPLGTAGIEQESWVICINKTQVYMRFCGERLSCQYHDTQSRLEETSKTRSNATPLKANANEVTPL